MIFDTVFPLEYKLPLYNLWLRYKVELLWKIKSSNEDSDEGGTQDLVWSFSSSRCSLNAAAAQWLHMNTQLLRTQGSNHISLTETLPLIQGGGGACLI